MLGGNIQLLVHIEIQNN